MQLKVACMNGFCRVGTGKPCSLSLGCVSVSISSRLACWSLMLKVVSITLCRTLDPEEADFFYVPAYASCYMHPVWGEASLPSTPVPVC